MILLMLRFWVTQCDLRCEPGRPFLSLLGTAAALSIRGRGFKKRCDLANLARFFLTRGEQHRVNISGHL